MDFSSFVLVLVALALCQTSSALAGETLYHSDEICGTFSARLELHLCFFCNFVLNFFLVLVSNRINCVRNECARHPLSDSGAPDWLL